MKKHLLLLLLLLMSVTAFAQNRLVSGEIYDKDTKDPVMQVTIQLLKSDSTYVTGGIVTGKQIGRAHV